ncbi:amidohydrolase family protein [Sphingomonas sp.]|uniref:amidohydrolase family protein n=1 Tax=Sphingomonas sp. TaxID=28214 RepID=UPI0039C941B3
MRLRSGHAGFQDTKLGPIRAGQLADCVILLQDIFAIDPRTIAMAKVLRTVVGGKDAYMAE